MNQENIRLSHLFEDVISDFIKKNPGLQANFEIENRLTVNGDYSDWRKTIEALVEHIVKFSAHATQPVLAFGRMENESVVVLMDDGFQFETDPDDTFLTISLLNQMPPGMIYVRRIVVKRGGGVWDINSKNAGTIFQLSFN